MHALMPETYEMKVLSSLIKVFPDTEPPFEPECTIFNTLKNEIFSFQVAYCSHMDRRQAARVVVESPLKEHIIVRTVELVPSSKPCHPITDDGYLRTKPGLYPDLLSALRKDTVYFFPNQWRALWVDVEIDASLPAGTYPITLRLEDKETNETLCHCSTNLQVLPAVLPPQTLIHTEWFHGDCLADYYHVEVFSPKHWEIMENFIRLAVKRGINMILTPLFTPPLDTAVGGERTTIQLIEVSVSEDHVYTFGFERLKRWVDMCQSCGVQYFEMSHLFTQWGAKCAPKIMATKNGNLQRIFGWDTPAVGGEYTTFLQQFLPALIQKLKEWKLLDRCYFHISDEPKMDHLESYRAAKESVGALLKEVQIIDALSDYDFYKQGIVENPIPSNNHIDAFIEGGVKNLWTYYCTSQYYRVSNRFMSMPSVRNRIYALQLYKYNIVGILHWGYNFYNAQYSDYAIDPYAVTDAGGAFPSGDPFLVYPGEDGVPEDSIRFMVLGAAMNDLRALQYLEKLAGRDFVLNLMEGNLSTPITFSQYPKSDLYLLSLRRRVNEEIAKRV